MRTTRGRGVRTEPVFVNLLRSPGIDSKSEDDTRNRVRTEPVFVNLLRSPEIDSLESIPRLLKRLQIRAQDKRLRL
jgi:hypothetical protein